MLFPCHKPDQCVDVLLKRLAVIFTQAVIRHFPFPAAHPSKSREYACAQSDSLPDAESMSLSNRDGQSSRYSLHPVRRISSYHSPTFSAPSPAFSRPPLPGPCSDGAAAQTTGTSSLMAMPGQEWFPLHALCTALHGQGTSAGFSRVLTSVRPP